MTSRLSEIAARMLMVGACAAALSSPVWGQEAASLQDEARAGIGDIAATALGEAEIRRYNITSFAAIRVATPQVSFGKNAPAGVVSVRSAGPAARSWAA